MGFCKKFRQIFIPFVLGMGLMSTALAGTKARTDISGCLISAELSAPPENRSTLPLGTVEMDFRQIHDELNVIRVEIGKKHLSVLVGGRMAPLQDLYIELFASASHLGFLLETPFGSSKTAHMYFKFKNNEKSRETFLAIINAAHRIYAFPMSVLQYLSNTLKSEPPTPAPQPIIRPKKEPTLTFEQKYEWALGMADIYNRQQRIVNGLKPGERGYRDAAIQVGISASPEGTQFWPEDIELIQLRLSQRIDFIQKRIYSDLQSSPDFKKQTPDQILQYYRSYIGKTYIPLERWVKAPIQRYEVDRAFEVTINLTEE